MMRFATLFVAATLSVSAFAATPAKSAAHVDASTDPRLQNAYKFNEGGWTYVHLEGSPEQVGFQHGYLLAHEIEDNLSVYEVMGQHNDDRSWNWFRGVGKTIFWPHIEPEYQAELKGIAEGLHAEGSKIDLWDIVALNGYLEIADYYLPSLDKKEHKPAPPAAVAPGKCSAFIATGSATKDGGIVIAHSNWSSYAEGERWDMVFDIVPEKGQHILMDGLPGVITSQDDFGINAAGLMITETTLPMAKGFDVNGIPEFERSRKAMQYATSIDEYAAIMRKGDNGGYANSWLVGDRKTGEIGYLELGLHNTPLKKKKDGYFVSSNFAWDPKLIHDDTPGFDPTNLESTMNARHLRADMFMQEHYGKLDIALAGGVSLGPLRHLRTQDGRGEARSLCGHEDTSPVGEKVWDDPPYDPGVARLGQRLTSSELAAKMSFTQLGRPSLRRRFSRRAVPEGASGVRMAEVNSARHDRRTVDAVQRKREGAGDGGGEIEPKRYHRNNKAIFGPRHGVIKRIALYGHTGSSVIRRQRSFCASGPAQRAWPRRRGKSFLQITVPSRSSALKRSAICTRSSASSSASRP